MGETELEDGEACAYQEDDYTSIDPDVSLSYIDEKIQNVLGHFKKDFEGVVSVENLGAKYGTYGSFLPTYRRSPVWSHSRTPPRVQNHVTSQSPNVGQEEGGHPNSLVRANATDSVRGGYGSSLVHKAPSQNDLCRQTTRTQSKQSLKECIPQSEAFDRKTLKVRIKVGSDNFPGKKSAAIFSGLGLDGSPSSFDESPVESRVLTHGKPFEAYESPTQIIQMMTSFPLYGGYLLSPLPYDLIELSETPKVLQGIFTQTSLKANRENSVIGHPKDSKASSGESVAKLLDRKGLSLQAKRDGKNSDIGLDFSLKDSDIDAVSCEELISDALKLPLLSSTDYTFGESAKASLSDKSYSEITKREPPVQSFIDDSLSDKPNREGNSVRNVVNNGVAVASNEMTSNSGNIGNNRGEAANSSMNTDTVGFKSKNTSKSVLKEPLKQKGKKSLSCEGEKNRLSSGDKKKSKKGKTHGFASRNEGMRNTEGSAWELKGGNCADTGNHACRSELKTSSFQKELSKGWNKYEDFFGELNEQEADLMDSPDVPSKDRLKTLQAVDEATLVHENTSRETTGSSDISRRAEAGIDLKDDIWVCCDKCHKRRLLPPGTKVDSLPKKWICSMMNWLPDMNNCSISAEETTKALRAHYQLLSENPNSTLITVERLHMGAAAADISDPVLSKDGKLIDKRRKKSKSSFEESPNQSLSSLKKKQQSAKDKTASGGIESPVVNELEFDLITKSDDTFVETNQHNKIDKRKADCDWDRGHAKKSMIESRREPDRDYHRISKKSKKRSMQTGNNDWANALDEGNGISMLSSEYATNTARNGQMTNSEFVSSQISKHSLEDNSLNTNDKSTCQHAISLHDRKSGGGSVAPKKRKTDHFQDPPNSAPSSGVSISDNEHFNKKKHSVPKSEWKEHYARNGKADKRSKNILRQSLDNTESLQKDSTCAQPVLAASCSSKDSGSLKAKSYVQELKVSPMESVCGSLKANLYSDDGYRSEAPTSDRGVNEATRGESLSNTKLSCSEKPCKNSSSLVDDKEMLKYNSDEGEVKIPEFCDNSHDQKPGYEKKEGDRKFKEQEKCGFSVAETENDIICHKQESSILKSKAHLDYDEMRSSLKFNVDKKSNQLVSTAEREKSQCLTPSDGEKNETSNCPQLYQGNGMSSLSSDASASNLTKELKRNKKADRQNGTHHTMPKHTISNGHGIKNQDTSSPLRRDSSSEAARNAIKEARNLKHLADRLKKNNGSSESTKFYFEAALKFLHGASLLESGKTENARHADMAESMEIYSSTAKLCEFCAREYERSKDMATAALAYKCMEVAYMRVICISHQSANRDRHELQTVLQILPPGESPASSASDIDNLNNSVTGDKAPQARSSVSPQLAADLVITARNRPNFERLLNFAQNINLAMEASRKSRFAFSASNVGMDQLDSKEGITSVKRALDFNFHDVDGLLRLVRLAKDVTSD